MIEALRELALPIAMGLLAGAVATLFIVLCYLGIKVWEQR